MSDDKANTNSPAPKGKPTADTPVKSRQRKKAEAPQKNEPQQNEPQQTEVKQMVQDGERVALISLSELRSPEFHPFQVRDDESMQRLSQNIAKYGVREPAIARPLTEGKFELLSGNRRKRACELVGLKTMPVIVRQMDDDEAAITIADSNLEHRETLLPSEKAWAYRIKLEALYHRGARSDATGSHSVEILCEQSGESKNQVFRYVRLTELIPGLLDKVDAKQIAFNAAVELSFLTRIEQTIVMDILEQCQTKPSLSQAQHLKKASQSGGLTAEHAESILTKPKQKKDSPVVFERFIHFFPKSYTTEQMEKVIITLLSDWSENTVKVNNTDIASERGVA